MFFQKKKSNLRLGKLAPKFDPRTLKLANYLQTDIALDLVKAPDSYHWESKIPSWPMMLNDRLGDCTIAGVGHLIQEWTTYTGTPVILSDDEIVQDYSLVSGYDPHTHQNDNGAAELDVLKIWKNSGFQGHKIEGFASIDLNNQDLIKDSIYLFGGIYIGIALPKSAQNQAIWDTSTGWFAGNTTPGSWGGHAVIVVGFDSNYLYVITWGAVKKMTYRFWSKYVDEAYAVLSPDWKIAATTKAPNNFAWDELENDLKKIG